MLNVANPPLLLEKGRSTQRSTKVSNAVLICPQLSVIALLADTANAHVSDPLMLVQNYIVRSQVQTLLEILRFTLFKLDISNSKSVVP